MMNKQNIIKNAYLVVEEFEKQIAEYCGAQHAVAVSSCCNAIFLSALYVKKVLSWYGHAILPKHTYPGVACSLINAGFKVEFKDLVWRGSYTIDPLYIDDCALSFKKGMHVAGHITCLSFHIKKHIPIGRGGMVLTDNPEMAEWLRKARYDGRTTAPLNEDKITEVGWNMYMTPEQAGRGLMLFDTIKNKELPDINFESQNYPDLSKIKAYV